MLVADIEKLGDLDALVTGVGKRSDLVGCGLESLGDFFW